MIEDDSAGQAFWEKAMEDATPNFYVAEVAKDMGLVDEIEGMSMFTDAEPKMSQG